MMTLKEAVKKYNDMFGPIPYEIVQYMDDDEQLDAIAGAVENGKPLEHNYQDDVII